MFDYSLLERKISKGEVSIGEIATVLGKEESEVWDILKGEGYLDMDSIGILCEKLRCQVSDIVRWEYETDRYVNVDWGKVDVPLTSLAVRCGLCRSAFTNAKKYGYPVKRENYNKLCEILGKGDLKK